MAHVRISDTKNLSLMSAPGGSVRGMETQWTLPGFAQSEGLRELISTAEARGAEVWAGLLARQAMRVTAGCGFAVAVGLNLVAFDGDGSFMRRAVGGGHGMVVP